MEAQRFMNEHGLMECWEVDGVFYKRLENAEKRSRKKEKEVIRHEINAGVRRTSDEEN